ncbi:MAG: AMP-binding protein, partial [Actinobacteria bacterium]|nr:AMP-binding protein [Actinomycetota bacterium]
MTTSRLPADLRTLPAILELRAAAQGDRPFLTVGGTRRSFAEMRDAIARRAAAFAAAGVQAGDRVAIVSENRLEVLDAWFASAWLGAILVPVNTATRGLQLEHVLTNSGPRVLALEAEFLPHLEVLGTVPDELERLWALDPVDTATWRGLPVEPFPELAEPVPAAPVGPGDAVSILYTSGTTGPSKGVVCPQAQFYWWALSTAAVIDGLSADDVLYTCLPLFHTNALNACMQALVHGAQFVVGPRFSASRFWDRVVEADATVTYLLGAMVSILSKTPACEAEKQHRVRVALAPATPTELHELFRDRFRMILRDGFGMTETNAVIGALDGKQRPGTMGYAMPGYEIRVVDENDEVVPDGTPGELVMRADEPYAFASGYWRMPEQTVESWRNLWFHSGDRAVREEDGSFRFLDRMKDAIRRRGENISAWEVEQVLQSHPDVAAAAAIPVPSELAEDEVMAVVVPREGAVLDYEELIRHCEPRLAYFAVPRYLEVAEALPLTPNGKV